MVEAIDGAPLAPGSRATIRFGSDGRVSGDASCNTYSDRYTLADEGLYLSNPIATRKACAPSLMTQEGRFMEVLRNVQRFEIAPDGALVLHAGEEHSIRARR